MPKTAGGDRNASIAARKQVVTVVHFRQLCALGLGGQIIMPALLRTLAEILPYDDGAFCWADEDGRVCNRCEEFPAESARPPQHVAERVLADGLPGWPARLPACERGAHCLRLFVGDGARPRGVLVLVRDAAQRPFTVRDETLLLRLADYLNKGVQTQRNQRAPYVSSGESGLVLLDQGGAVHQACAVGRRLLLHAACARLPSAADSAGSAAMEVLGARLGRAFADAAQPVVRLQNDWGLFEFRPHRLTLGNGRSGGLGVSVVRHEPLALRLMRGMKTLDLSSRQKETVLLLAYGYSHRDMAERMGVSYHTAIDHVRKLHDKLGVSETARLLDRVMGSGEPEADADRVAGALAIKTPPRFCLDADCRSWMLTVKHDDPASG